MCIWRTPSVGFTGLNGHDTFLNDCVAITKSWFNLRLRYVAKALNMREAHDRLSVLANNAAGSFLALFQEQLCFGGLCQENVE